MTFLWNTQRNVRVVARPAWPSRGGVPSRTEDYACSNFIRSSPQRWKNMSRPSSPIPDGSPVNTVRLLRPRRPPVHVSPSSSCRVRRYTGTGTPTGPVSTTGGTAPSSAAGDGRGIARYTRWLVGTVSEVTSVKTSADSDSRLHAASSALKSVAVALKPVGRFNENPYGSPLP